MQNKDPRITIITMCHNFYTQGWVSGTGGGMSIRHGDRVYMMPSGVEKEKVRLEDIFVLNLEGKVLEPPTNSDLKNNRVRSTVLFRIPDARSRCGNTLAFGQPSTRNHACGAQE